MLVTADMSEEVLTALRALGEVEYASFRQAMRLLAGPALVEAAGNAEVLVTEVDVVDADALAKLPGLRVVVACRGQAVNVDVAACAAYGIPVLHAPGRNAEAVADLTLAFLLMLARKLPAATAFLREPGIEPGDMGRMGQAFTTLQGRELWRKTIGLVGFGAVGRAVARRLAGFGARVLAHDPHVPADEIAPAGAEASSLDGLLAESDFVSLHAAVTDESRHMLGADELARMKGGAFLVNTARAALVDEDALVAALRSGHLAGAALDVFSVEPPGSDHPLLALDTVIATPHVGGNTVEVATHQGEIVAEDLARLLAGERPRHVLDPEVLDRFDWDRPRPAADASALAQLAARPAPAPTDVQRAPVQPAPAEVPTSAAPPEVVERMTRVVGAFTARLARDAALARFAAGKDVTLRFTVTDLGIVFYLRLRDGTVAAALGDPDAAADVELAMRAEVLDGMFTGRVNPMQAATGGRLSFRGDTVKAMALQQEQADLARCYAEARAEAGDPGDLAALPQPAGARRVTPVRPVTPGDVREELIQVVNELYAAGLVTATGGNASVRAPGENEIWITPSQFFKGHLRPDQLVRLDLDGTPLDEGAPSPSSERLMHCAIYRARPDAQAIVHAHAPYATILADTGLPFAPISTEAAFFGDIPRVPFIMPGTEELARAVGEAARESWAVLMVNHGLIVAGRTLRRAADMVEIVDRSAQVILGCHAVGQPPSTLPDDVVRTLRQMGDLLA
jgi:phosphoglycerate dehydrogenase-like enzyme/ribulose-5-phosphate 4-epimerase/fuculose-1-phosphate aldolase/putative sterol carrier protein